MPALGVCGGVVSGEAAKTTLESSLRRFKLIRARHSVPCYWCGDPIDKNSATVWYPDESVSAHEQCHREACT